MNLWGVLKRFCKRRESGLSRAQNKKVVAICENCCKYT